MEIIRTHPMNIVRGTLQENPFFIPAEQLLQARQGASQGAVAIPPRSEQENGVESAGADQLRSYIRDLLGVLALSAIWRGGDSHSIIEILLEGIIEMLPLEFAFAGLAQTPGGAKEYFCKSSTPNRRGAEEMARLLEGALQEGRPTEIANPLGAGTLRVVFIPLGAFARWGTLVAGCRDPHFPEQSDLLLLTVASNQAALALEDAHARSLEGSKLRLEAEKLQSAADLARLRAHLEPHFLLNTLNAIAGLVTADPPAARRLLVSLGDLLRDSVRDDDEMQTLDEQIAWLQRYAYILETRHAGRLAFRWKIADDARPVLAPWLLLQPLIENAVKHGALRRPRGGEVSVSAKVAVEHLGSSRLVCTIEDNGPGLPAGDTRREAFGLFAVRRQLALKYGDQANLRLESSSSGTRSIVELPAQRKQASRRAS